MGACRGIIPVPSEYHFVPPVCDDLMNLQPVRHQLKANNEDQLLKIFTQRNHVMGGDDSKHGGAMA